MAHGYLRFAVPPKLINVSRFLKDWLGKHIKETDMKYGPCMVAKGLK
jgi:hemerythrin